MSIVAPDVVGYDKAEPVFPYGMPLVSDGLVNIDAVDGFGLLTRGFLWELYQIWFDIEFYDGLSTSWGSSEAQVTTNWASSEANITTMWTAPQFGIYGEYTP